ncbi:divergent polysaccharide deacetylase family protein [Salicola sp. Rm-C-2C1-2]|uniref:divergent polysaccharide deacetylase family protein n=1 Tax=Salicola sp. Rm-C-2C1-2 TaxID=3141321 RepID=UPI0032E4D19B
MRSVLVLVLCAVLLGGSGTAAGQGPPPTIAIIIDDLGLNRGAGERLLAMDQPLTLAFLPHRPYTREQATAAAANGKQVLLHAPMANEARIGLGPGGLAADMSRKQVHTTLKRALASVPGATGVNNHMGSLLTQVRKPMDWVMEAIAGRNLLFIDSRTTSATVAEDRALSQDVPAMSRDVFLDNRRDTASIHEQFRLLLKKARDNGTAIAIGHPYEETLDYLEAVLPELDRHGYAIATVSTVWSMRHDNQPVFPSLPNPRLVQQQD